MQTHDDRDSPRPTVGDTAVRYLRSQIERKAEEMTARGENMIAAGKPGEEPLRDMCGKLFVRQRIDRCRLEASQGDIAKATQEAGRFLQHGQLPMGEEVLVVGQLRRFGNSQPLFLDVKARGVRFIEEPRREPFGTVVVFEDLYGNRWDLIQRVAAERH